MVLDDFLRQSILLLTIIVHAAETIQIGGSCLTFPWETRDVSHLWTPNRHAPSSPLIVKIKSPFHLKPRVEVEQGKDRPYKHTNLRREVLSMPLAQLKPEDKYWVTYLLMELIWYLQAPPGDNCIFCTRILK
jgi:hypothetical protein